MQPPCTPVTAGPVVQWADRLEIPREPRYRSLDVWRGIACLAVVFYHATLTDFVARQTVTGADVEWTLAALVMWTTNQLWIGVPMFFVISGYCIAATADATRRRRVSMWTYFARRFRRIFPPYWAAIVFTVAVTFTLDYLLFPGFLSSEPRAHPRPWWFSMSQWFGNLTLTETWRPHLFGDPRGHIVGQSWTLCYEEQFYAAIGLLLLVRPRGIFTGAVLTTAACLAVQIAALAFDWPIGGFFFDGSWFLFAAGILVYYLLNYSAGRLRHALIAGLVVLPLLPFAAPAFFVPGSTVGFLFAGVIWLLRRWDDALMRMRVIQPLAFCGTICYSMYLVHAIVVRAITKALYAAGARGDLPTLLIVLPICVAASVLSGWIFFLMVERRFLNQPQPSAGPAVRGRWEDAAPRSLDGEKALDATASTFARSGPAA